LAAGRSLVDVLIGEVTMLIYAIDDKQEKFTNWQFGQR
jgi:hypothetical protein